MAERGTRVERLAASWWILLTLVPFGILGWGALVFAGARADRRSWVWFGIAYLAMQVVGWPLLGESADDSAPEWIGFMLVMASWVASFVHALVIRGPYLDAKSFRHPELARAEMRVQTREEARRIARDDPQRARELGVGRPDLPDAFDGELVDLNNAPVDAIDRLPGVSRDLAERIVHVREEVHGFESLEDAALVLDLPAPLVDRIRPDVVVLPRGLEV